MKNMRSKCRLRCKDPSLKKSCNKISDEDEEKIKSCIEMNKDVKAPAIKKILENEFNVYISVDSVRRRMNK